MGSEDSRRILDMLAQGKISVDDAQQLLQAVGRPLEAAQAAASTEGASSPAPRYVRIEVNKSGRRPGESASLGAGKQVNIRVPIALIRSGMRLGAIVPGFAGDEIGRKLRERGIDVDLSKLDYAQFEDMLKNMGELTVDVDEGRAQVRITCE
jgi:hypothetical protein